MHFAEYDDFASVPHESAPTESAPAGMEGIAAAFRALEIEEEHLLDCSVLNLITAG